jgi:hypothetical protein
MTGNQHPEILADLAYIARHRRTVKMIVNFRGMPIDLTAHIIRSSSTTGLARLRTMQRQMIPVQVDDQILLQSELFPFTVMAKVRDFNLRNQIVTLKDLHYANGSIGNRKHVRVQPEYKLQVKVVTAQGYQVPGRMIDLSLVGISAEMEVAASLVDEVLPTQSQVEVMFQLPKGSAPRNQDLRIQARVAHLHVEQNVSMCRVGLFILLTDGEQQILRRYIFDRQTSILNDIKQMNNKMLQALV